jgi:hypothetical protein
MDIIEFYKNAKEFVLNSEFRSEVEWCRHRKPFEDVDAIDFFQEYVWVVLNSGFNERRARGLYDKFMTTLDLSIIKHEKKRYAIETGLKNFVEWRGKLRGDAITDKIEFLDSLPHIGPVTKYHLARNIGFDCVKPDVHLSRLAVHFGFETPLAMCQEIQKHDPEKLGTIDVILWRFCTVKGSKNLCAISE